MTKPTFQWQLSLGNVIQIAMLIVAGAVGWTTFDARITANEKALASSYSEQRGIGSRVRALETSTARADERFTSILSILGRMDARLERMEQSR